MEAKKRNGEIPKFNEMTPEQIKLHDDYVRQLEEKNEKEQRFYVFTNCGIGSLYADTYDLHNFKVDNELQKIMLQKARLFYKRNTTGEVSNMVLTGNAGQGKTMLMVGLLREFCNTVKRTVYDLNDYYSVRYITSKDFCDLVKKSQSFSNEKTMEKVINDFVFYDVLAVDEIGKSTDRFEFEVLFSLLDKRMQARKCTMLASNMTYEELNKSMGDYGMSRLNIHGNLICVNTCGINDYRQK